MECHLKDTCSGCDADWLGTDYAAQLLRKQTKFTDDLKATLDLAELPPFTMVAISSGGFREKADLIFQKRDGKVHLGFYAKNRRDVVAPDACPQMTPALRAWYDEVAAHPPDVNLGSVRLRVSPAGQRGIWLDFSNVDIKRLLDEGTWLRQIAGGATVEIGQKRKRLVEKANGLGLGDAVFAPWTKTFAGGAAVPLLSTIGSFTQVGSRANRAIAETVEAFLPEVADARWTELGCGVGTLTFALLAKAARVDAVENDPLSVAALSASARAAREAGRLTIHPLSFFAATPAWPELIAGATGILADPPRSGLRNFIAILAAVPAEQRPRYFLYVSCAAESFLADARGLSELGYRLTRISGVDQFPQTPHLETVALFELPK